MRPLSTRLNAYKRIMLYTTHDGAQEVMKAVRHAAIDADMNVGDWVLLAMREKLLREKRISPKAAA